MFSKLTMVLSLVVLVSFVASPALAAPGDSWSLSGDFSITNGNPNQVGDGSWEYHTGAGPMLMDVADTDWYIAENPPQYRLASQYPNGTTLGPCCQGD